MSEEKKAREFWILHKFTTFPFGPEMICYEEKPHDAYVSKGTELIHVIEYSALEAERARSAKLVAALKAIYSEAKKGDGTTTECEMAAQAEQALAAHHESEEK